MSCLSDIWRYPIKAHGAEKLDGVRLEAGKTMPWDRAWAVLHEAAKVSGTEWAKCANFSRGAKAPSLMAIQSSFDDNAGVMTLSHPDCDDLRINPDTESALFLKWVAPLMPADRAQSTKVIRADRGMTDTSFASISILSHSSLDALSKKAGQSLSPRRFRGNLWLEGFEPWEEFNWIDKTVRIGDVGLQVVSRITRCLATHANPDTGDRDVETLSLLQREWGHKDFGVYAKVMTTGEIKTGDTVQVL